MERLWQAAAGRPAGAEEERGRAGNPGAAAAPPSQDGAEKMEVERLPSGRYACPTEAGRLVRLWKQLHACKPVPPCTAFHANCCRQSHSRACAPCMLAKGVHMPVQEQGAGNSKGGWRQGKKGQEGKVRLMRGVSQAETQGHAARVLQTAGPGSCRLSIWES